MANSSSTQDYVDKASDMADAALGHARTMRDTATAMADDARQAAGPAMDAARDTARRFGAQAEEMAGEVYQRGSRAAQSVGQRIEQQPLLGMLAAFALGYAVSYLLRPRAR